MYRQTHRQTGKVLQIHKSLRNVQFPSWCSLACRYDADRHAIVVDLEGYNFLLDPANVRRNDTSAASIDEWTGERLSRSNGISDDIKPDTIAPLGNYAVQILWQDGFNQVRSPAVMS